MLNRVIQDARAWQRDTIDPVKSWYQRFSPKLMAAVDRTINDVRRRPQPVSTIQLKDTPCAGFVKEFQPVLQVLETGRGFVILRGIPLEQYESELPAIYWLVGQLLGRPYAQNVQGTLLYDVRDTGQDVRYGARFSVTSAESTFHTDNSFGEEVLDYVGLLCLKTARQGGLSQMVSGYAVHNRLLKDYPEVLKTLYQPFQVDRRGGVLPGQGPTIPFPVFSWDGEGLLCRYLRYWIEAGHERAGQPLNEKQKEALDVLDEVLASPDLRTEFALEPGDMYFINNRWILHNRTAFADFDEPEKKRHLVRLWLSRF